MNIVADLQKHRVHRYNVATYFKLLQDTFAIDPATGVEKVPMDKSGVVYRRYPLNKEYPIPSLHYTERWAYVDYDLVTTKLVELVSGVPLDRGRLHYSQWVGYEYYSNKLYVATLTSGLDYLVTFKFN